MKKRVVVVGGGPGGYVAAIRAAQLGAEVHLAEEGNLGGTCLNAGCIPTKALLHTAGLYRAVRREAGLIAGDLRVNWPALMTHKSQVVSRLVQGVAGLLTANRVTVHKGRAVLQDAHTVRVDGAAPVSLRADIIVLAVGSIPQPIPVPGIDSKGVIDSTAALNLPGVPQSLVIIGGGVIGTEFAALYNAFGAKVTVVEMLPQILPPVDGQIAAKIRDKLSEDGVIFLTGVRLEKVLQTPDGPAAVVQQGAKGHELAGEYIMIAAGRMANSRNVGLEAAGIKTERGKIAVNDYFATNVPHIYAIGDCNARTMLAHAASAQGAAAVEHALGHRPGYNPKVIPYCIYTSPEAAGVGLTEEQAQKQGIGYKTGLFPLTGNGKALIENGESGLIKIIADSKYGEILGAHLFGPRATDLIAEAALAMTLEATVDDLVATIHAHPTVSEALAEAALNVSGRAIHWPPGLKV